MLDYPHRPGLGSFHVGLSPILLIAFGLVLITTSAVSLPEARLRVRRDSELIRDETLAREFLEAYDAQAQKVYYTDILAAWTYNTNITEHNQQKSIETGLVRAQLLKEAYVNASKFDWEHFQDPFIKRQFKKLAIIGSAALPEEKIAELDRIRGDQKTIYSTGEVCSPPGQPANQCLALDPGLTRLLRESRDWNTLLWAWKGWREATGGKMRDMYERFVELQNEAAEINGFADAGEYWKSLYEMEGFEEEVARLWNQVKPLYQHLHAYVKRKLQEHYKDNVDDFPDTGHIPAHILGNMWAQNWANLLDILTPFPNKTPMDITQAMVDQGYNATRMFKLAEAFFVSLGLEPMPQSFWENSMIVRPEDGRQVVCHASAWDFYNQRDFRVKQCTDITEEDLETTHHEMGHIQYYLMYKHQPLKFRRGANPGFHEAVGDVMSLSVSTPEHLHEIGLLGVLEEDREADLNFLMNMALQKIAFLPFGYLIDQWRWSVFSGETTKQDYTKKWWELRCKHQGITPPVARGSEDFDPGAKYHIPANTPYIRYFVSYILQFQFQKALCDVANSTRPLHRCDIYNSHEAGQKLREMLSLGSSVPWPEALKKLTGQENMDAAPLVEYFKPLHDWLKEQNEGYDVTWDEECPQGFISASSKSIFNISSLIIVMTVIFTFH